MTCTGSPRIGETVRLSFERSLYQDYVQHAARGAHCAVCLNAGARCVGAVSAGHCLYGHHA